VLQAKGKLADAERQPSSLFDYLYTFSLQGCGNLNVSYTIVFIISQFLPRFLCGFCFVFRVYCCFCNTVSLTEVCIEDMDVFLEV
jgi:hypothetical protein